MEHSFVLAVKIREDAKELSMHTQMFHALLERAAKGREIFWPKLLLSA